MDFSQLFEELLAISLVDVEECKNNKDKMKYLKVLILDFYEKLENEKIIQDIYPVDERDIIKFKIVKDTSLSANQKMILYNNFFNDKIKSMSRFRRIMIQKRLV